MELAKEAGAKRAIRLQRERRLPLAAHGAARGRTARKRSTPRAFADPAFPGLLERERAAGQRSRRLRGGCCCEQLTSPVRWTEVIERIAALYPGRAVRRDGPGQRAHGPGEADRARREVGDLRHRRRRRAAARHGDADADRSCRTHRARHRQHARHRPRDRRDAARAAARASPSSGATQARAAEAAAAIGGGARGFACDVADTAAVDGARRGRRERLRLARHPRQQRRAHARQHPHAPQGRGLGRRARREPARRVRRRFAPRRAA